MMRRAIALAFVLIAGASAAQFPLHRSLVMSPGQQRPAILCITQDTLGLLWMGADIGIMRTDGEQVDVILRTEKIRVNAIATIGRGVVAALADGTLLRCDNDRCDTLLIDPLLAEHPVRAITVGTDGRIHLATYGAGLWTYDAGNVNRLNTRAGLPDDHVNGLALLPDGRIVAGTDQGVAVCADGRVMGSFDASKGAPDNLILCVAVDHTGLVYAGTDGGGVFSWRPGTTLRRNIDPEWTHGPVVSIAVHADMVWAGTERQGVVLLGLDERTTYTQDRTLSENRHRSMGLFPDREGAVWWCDGTERIHRADPAVLFVPEHEGVDMQGISALCVDRDDRIWFASSEGLFHHATAFSENAKVIKVPLDLDPRTPIVSLASSADGTVWAATFGDGVHAISPTGVHQHFDRSNGLGNENVLAVRAHGDSVWFATLDGVSRWSAGRFEILKGTEGFTFDVLPLGGDHALIATDGRGVLRWDEGVAVPLSSNARTYYSLVSDDRGGVWTCGPSTGLCNVGATNLSCVGAGRSPFDGDLFALGWTHGRAIAFGSTGTMALDPRTGKWTDLTSRFGLEGIQAQLNVVAQDRHGALWFGSDQGLVRIDPDEQHFQPDVPVIITDMVVNGVRFPTDTLIRTTHDRNDITIHFTALYYADPAALHFEYRMDDGRTVRTRDREFALPGLSPGTHRLHLRAFVGEPGPASPWRILTVEVSEPWWRRWEFVVPIVLVLLALVIMFSKARDARLRDKERVEQEKVRYQLEALRSQVDPHFLFNSFNTLVALIETDRDKAVEHVDALSTFFRSMLVVRDKDLIPLSEELELLKHYFGLEQRRFGNAIDLLIHLENGSKTYFIVPLTLQLLVENALKHNTATKQQPLRVELSMEGDVLVVRNDVRPRASAPRSTGFGLDSIVKRYTAITPRPVEVKTEAGRFEVRIPLLHRDEHSDR